MNNERKTIRTSDVALARCQLIVVLVHLESLLTFSYTVENNSYVNSYENTVHIDAVNHNHGYSV